MTPPRCGAAAAAAACVWRLCWWQLLVAMKMVVVGKLQKSARNSRILSFGISGMVSAPAISPEIHSFARARRTRSSACVGVLSVELLRAASKSRHVPLRACDRLFLSHVDEQNRGECAASSERSAIVRNALKDQAAWARRALPLRHHPRQLRSLSVAAVNAS
jgi:hypothetical protein